MLFRIRWVTLLAGVQGIGIAALPLGLARAICQELNSVECGAITHWVELHEYHRSLGRVVPLAQEFEKPSSVWMWN